MLTLKPQPLTAEAFAPFGDVIETRDRDFFMINKGNTQRYHRLADVSLGKAEDTAIISIFKTHAYTMPMPISMLERHPLGSQAFIPLNAEPFLIVVAPLGETPDVSKIQAFISDGQQGINYHTGVWHHPVISCAAEDSFLVIDRAGEGHNCDEYDFPAEMTIQLLPA